MLETSQQHQVPPALSSLASFSSSSFWKAQGQRDVALDAPCLPACGELGLSGEPVGHVLHPVAVGGAHHEHVVYHLVGDSVGNLADSVGSGDGHHLGSQLLGLLAGAPGHVAETGHRNPAASSFLPTRASRFWVKYRAP